LNNSDKNQIWDLFTSDKKSFCVISHTNPDGDAMGSALAMKLLLKKLGHEAEVLVPNIYPDYYAWLKDADKIIIGDEQRDKAVDCIEEADILLFMDLNKVRRVEGLDEFLLASDAPKILFDHHVGPDEVFKLQFARTDVSSTCELVYEFISEFDKSLLDKDIADCLYTGIVTDTGNYFHGNITAGTFRITADLIDLGIDVLEINQKVYNTFSESRIRMLGHSLINRMEVLHDKETVVMYLTKDDLKKFNDQEGDTEGIVNYGLTIKGIKISALFIERAQYIKISFRSEGDVNVNQIAVNYYDGGGHKNASGAYFYGSIEDAILRFKQALNEIEL